IKSYKSLAFIALLIATLAVGWVAFGKLAVAFAFLGIFFAALLSVVTHRILHQPVVVMICAFLIIVSYHVIVIYHEVQPIYGKVEMSVAQLSRIVARTRSSY